MTRTVIDVDPLDDHCAKFSDGIIKELAICLRKFVPRGSIVVDMFAGVGGIHAFAPEYDTHGIELEAEWAATHHRTRQGTALELPYDDGTVDCVATSACYGNRMADTYDGSRDTCRHCGGDGLEHGSAWMAKPCALCEGDHYRRDCPDGQGGELIELPCSVCAGSGKHPSKRNTYTSYLGRPLTEGSAAAMQWGPEYRQFHADAWREAVRVLRPGGHLMLNMSDHVRGGELQGVTIWHASMLGALLGPAVHTRAIRTRRHKHGANRDLRPEAEWLMVFRKESVARG